MSGQRSAYRITTPPAVEPISLADLKAELGIPSGDTSQDAMLTRTIRTARILAEDFTNRCFITTGLTYQTDGFPRTGQRDEWWDGVREGAFEHIFGGGSDAPFTLPRPRLLTITSISYYDTNGSTHTLDPATYWADTMVEPGRVFGDGGWPTDARARASVQVTYTAGYGPAATDVPAPIIDAMISHIRDVVERPNAAVSSESIDNASVVYGNAAGSVTSRGTGAAPTGLRGDAERILAPYRVHDSPGIHQP